MTKHGKAVLLAPSPEDADASLLADVMADFEAVNQAQSMIEFAPDGTVLRANQNFLKLMGYSLAEIVGRNHAIFCAGEFQPERGISAILGVIAPRWAVGGRILQDRQSRQ
jgi:PAS domain-containing protein